jgi:hypothetical protein
MALSLGAEGVTHLEPGDWEATVGYRYLDAQKGYTGREYDGNYAERVGAHIIVHSWDVQATYQFTPRLSATFTMPFLTGEAGDTLSHDRGRGKTRAGGLGDIRLIGTMWLLPEEYEDGNVALGLGVKAPTGDEESTDEFRVTTDGPPHRELRNVDISIQPGDGGWGMDLEVTGYHRLYHDFFGYVSGFYLFNPRNTNNAQTQILVYRQFRDISVPDQYMGRAGASWAIWPEQGVTVSVGGRIDGMPVHDAIGDSDGFRRPGYALYVEPGISWTHGKNTVNFFIPTLVGANREKNTLDEQNGGHGPGAYADYLLIFGVSHRF